MAEAGIVTAIEHMFWQPEALRLVRRAANSGVRLPWIGFPRPRQKWPSWQRMISVGFPQHSSRSGPQVDGPNPDCPDLRTRASRLIGRYVGESGHYCLNNEKGSDRRSLPIRLETTW